MTTKRFLVALAASTALAMGPAATAMAAPPDNRPPDNRPPGKGGGTQVVDDCEEDLAEVGLLGENVVCL